MWGLTEVMANGTFGNRATVNLAEPRTTSRQQPRTSKMLQTVPDYVTLPLAAGRGRPCHERRPLCSAPPSTIMLPSSHEHHHPAPKSFRLYGFQLRTPETRNSCAPNPLSRKAFRSLSPAQLSLPAVFTF